jgi:hypothetical protein
MNEALSSHPALAVKPCSACGTLKPVTAFLISRYAADGHTDKCLLCILETAAHDRARREFRGRAAAG